MSATLADIQLTFRKITAQYQQSQITDAQINAFVNRFYLYDLPEHLKLIDLKTNWTFTTLPNTEYVNIDVNAFVNVEPPAYCSGYQLSYFQSQTEFYNVWPEFNELDQFSLGDGTAGPFTFTLPNAPVIPGRVRANGQLEMTNVVIGIEAAAGGFLRATDNGAGGFDGNVVAGTIDYTTGVVTNLTFSNTTLAGAALSVNSIPYQSGRPTSLLFYRNQAILRPIPDNVYKITIQANAYPTTLAAQSDEPSIRQWWQLLAYGAAYKYFSELKDTDNLQYVKVLLDEQMNLAERRTIKQISSNRVATIYNSRSHGRRGYYYFPQGGL